MLLNLIKIVIPTIIVLLTESAKCSAEVPFTIFALNEISSNLIYPVAVAVFDRPKAPLHVEVSIHHNNNLIQAKTVEFKKKGFKVVVFQPAKRTPGEYEVRAKVTSEKLELNEKAGIIFHNDTILIFIQTDRSVYRPGQKILFRVLLVNETLVPVKKTINIFLRVSSKSTIN